MSKNTLYCCEALMYRMTTGCCSEALGECMCDKPYIHDISLGEDSLYSIILERKVKSLRKSLERSLLSIS